jgi:hypothetical protein
MELVELAVELAFALSFALSTRIESSLRSTPTSGARRGSESCSTLSRTGIWHCCCAAWTGWNCALSALLPDLPVFKTLGLSFEKCACVSFVKRANGCISSQRAEGSRLKWEDNIKLGLVFKADRNLNIFHFDRPWLLAISSVPPGAGWNEQYRPELHRTETKNSPVTLPQAPALLSCVKSWKYLGLGKSWASLNSLHWNTWSSFEFLWIAPCQN